MLALSPSPSVFLNDRDDINGSLLAAASLRRLDYCQAYARTRESKRRRKRSAGREREQEDVFFLDGGGQKSDDDDPHCPTADNVSAQCTTQVMGIEDQKEEREVLDSIFPDEITGMHQIELP